MTLDYINSAKALKQIATPIFKRHGINAFSHSTIYSDGSRAELWTDYEAMMHSFFWAKHISAVRTTDAAKQVEFFYYPHFVDSLSINNRHKILNKLRDQKEIFGHEHCFIMVKPSDDFVQYFAFYTKPDDVRGVNTFLTNLSELKLFTDHYQGLAKSFINDARGNRLISANPSFVKPEPLPMKKELAKLTTKEWATACLYSSGMSAKEISVSLNVTVKAIEKRLLGIYQKWGCHKKSEMIFIFNHEYHHAT